jgi:hypothetical protein
MSEEDDDALFDYDIDDFDDGEDCGPDCAVCKEYGGVEHNAPTAEAEVTGVGFQPEFVIIDDPMMVVAPGVNFHGDVAHSDSVIDVTAHVHDVKQYLHSDAPHYDVHADVNNADNAPPHQQSMKVVLYANGKAIGEASIDDVVIPNGGDIIIRFPDISASMPAPSIGFDWGKVKQPDPPQPTERKISLDDEK